MLEKGSMWRRWDLHVHTPGTALNDQFTGPDFDSQQGGWEEHLDAVWEKYLRAIESQKEVKVLGVTDYLTITNYSKMKKYKESGRLSNIDLLIPNIEFRLTPPTEKGTAINIHLLVSPDDPGHEEKIRNALKQLMWEYGERKYSCIPEQLIELGRAFRESQGDPIPDNEDHVALTAGVEQYRVGFNSLREWYKGQSWLSKNSIVVVDAGKDGLSGFRNNGAWAGHRQEITRFSQALFSGRPGEREFWLGMKNQEDAPILRNLGGLKPCIHGSDAHSFERLLKPKEDRFCWIKADTTFEGLKQILYEPASRIYIGPTAPTMHNQANVIDAVEFEASNHWFDNFSLPLNSDLVSIVGRKGSGKSALAELIAYAAGSWTSGQSEGFMTNAREHLEGMIIRLRWADKTTTETKIDINFPDGDKVCYLSQRFVEYLCADDRQGAELIKKIEEVVFSYIDHTDKLGASSFSELRALHTQSIQDERDRLGGEIAKLIKEGNLLYEKERALESKQNKIRELKVEQKKLQEQLSPLLLSEKHQIHDKLEKFRTDLAKAQRRVAVSKQKLQKIKDIQRLVDDFKGQMEKFYGGLQPALEEVSIPDSERSLFRPNFSGDPDMAIATRREALQDEVKKYYGVEESMKHGTVLWLRAEIERLSKLASKDQVRQQQIKGTQDKIFKINAQIDSLKSEVEEIRGPANRRRLVIREEKAKTYRALFENMEREEKVLEQLYIPAVSKVSDGHLHETDHSFAFTVEREVDTGNWLERGAELFDQRQRRTIPFGGMKEFEQKVRETLVPAWKTGSSGKIAEVMDQFIDEGFRKLSFPLQKCLRASVTVQDVHQWLYEIDHIHLKYGLKYDNVDLKRLSPGEKGMVLLLLYLSVDTTDTRPLIVDQPDDNLDNESVYKFLAEYFKKAKSRRQIILITHNPNLVINADSEQIVVAHCEMQANGLPHISYSSGALENSTSEVTGIKQQVCRILEGGLEAFQKRQRRYISPTK